MNDMFTTKRVIGTLISATFCVMIGSFFFMNWKEARFRKSQLEAPSSYASSIVVSEKHDSIVVTNKEMILRFASALKTNELTLWNHYIPLETLHFSIFTVNGTRFDLDGQRIRDGKGDRTIWLTFSGPQGIKVQYLYDWVEMVFRNQKRSPE